MVSSLTSNMPSDWNWGYVLHLHPASASHHPFCSAYPNYIEEHLLDCESFDRSIYRLLIRVLAGQERYYGSHYKRLQVLKQSIDPLNTFHFPTSIQE